MSGGYVLIAGIVLYIFILQKAGSSSFNPLTMAALFIGGYYVLLSVVSGLMYYSWNVPVLPNVLSIPTVLTALAQYITASVVFYKVNEDSEDYFSYLILGGLGFALIFLILPQSIQQLLSSLL